PPQAAADPPARGRRRCQSGADREAALRRSQPLQRRAEASLRRYLADRRRDRALWIGDLETGAVPSTRRPVRRLRRGALRSLLADGGHSRVPCLSCRDGDAGAEVAARHDHGTMTMGKLRNTTVDAGLLIK